MGTDSASPSANAYGLFIGVSRFDDQRHYGNRPSVEASAKALATAFASGGVWSLSAEIPRPLTGYVDKTAVLDSLEAAAGQNVDLLLIYIGCHGSRFHGDKNVHLALSDSRHKRATTHLPFSEIRDIIRDESQARLKLLLLDCCYADDSYLGAGTADNSAHGAANAPDQLVRTGVCTITATDALEEAQAKWNGTPYTAFAGAMLEVLNEGVANGPQLLTVQHLFDDLKRRLTQQNAPLPGMRNNAGSMPLVRNRHPSARTASTLERLELAQTDPFTYASSLRVSAEAGARTEDIRRLVAAFTQERPWSDVCELICAFLDGGRDDLATDALDHGVRLRDPEESGDLVHQLHSARQLPPDMPLTAMRSLPGRQLSGTVRRLCGNDCDYCEQVAVGLARAAADGGRDAEELTGFLKGLSGPHPSAAGGSAADRWGRTREQFLDRMPSTGLVDVAAGLWGDDHPGTAAGRGRRLDAAAAVERATNHTAPQDVWQLAVTLTERGFAELGAVLLESMAATGKAEEVAEVLTSAGRQDRADQSVTTLLSALARRRPPGFLAQLVRLVGDADPETAGRLLAVVIEEGTIRDASRTALALLQDEPPETDPSAARMVTGMMGRLNTGRFAEALSLVNVYGDAEAVDVMLARITDTDKAFVVDLLRQLKAGPEELIERIVGRTAARPVDDVLDLALMLEEADLPARAERLLKASNDSVPGDELVHAVAGFRKRCGPGDPRLRQLLQILARTVTVDQAYHLIIETDGWFPQDGHKVSGDVVRCMAVPTIKELVKRLHTSGYRNETHDLLSRTVEVFGDRDADGTQTAELILMLDRMHPGRQQREAARKLISGLATHGDARQIMDLVGKLLETQGKYNEHRATVENEVLRAFTWPGFMQLPGVYGHRFLPAVLEIELQAMLDPGRVPAERVPEMVRALKDAGVTQEKLRQLLGYVGRHRTVDPGDVTQWLRRAGLHDEAGIYLRGIRRRPSFL